MASDHFSIKALSCPCCGQNFCQQKTYDMLEQFRALVEQPVRVTSGYRCAANNAKVGGAPNSQHTHGLAADIWVPGMSAAELEVIARQCSLVTGVGRNDYKDFIHIDCRDNGPIAWCYGADGKQCVYYAAKSSTIAS